jgi:hypothetical protein
MRHAGGTCLDAPSVRGPCTPRVQSWHIRYRYDGVRITARFDYSTGAWHSL